MTWDGIRRLEWQILARAARGSSRGTLSEAAWSVLRGAIESSTLPDHQISPRKRAGNPFGNFYLDVSGVCLSVQDEKKIWVAALGYHRARLWCGRWGRGSRERLQFERIGEVGNPWEELIEDLEVAELPGGDGGRDAEFLARYAGDVARWLNTAVRKHEIHELLAFSPTRLWALLRPTASLPPALETRQIGEDLSLLSQGDLERHESVLRAARDEDQDASRRAS